MEALGQHTDQAEAGMVSSMALYAGASVRVGDLFGSKNIFNRMKQNMKQMGLQVTNKRKNKTSRLWKINLRMDDLHMHDRV